jgi:amidase
MEQSEYITYDAMGLAELVRKRDVSPRELVDVALRRADALNMDLNAVVVRRDDAVRAEAAAVDDGPFAGVPFLVKDMDGVLADEPNTSSSRSLVDWRPSADSELFARYKDSGLLIIGKTNAPEFGIMGVTESELRGPCHNPWNLAHTPGGSSGGSAAAVAARIVPAAHAGDGGGSIRIPASACGLFGLKPTRGRQPLGPYVGEGWGGMVAPHVVSRSVRDSAALLDVTHGADLGAPYAEPAAPRSFLLDSLRSPGKLRIGFSTKAMLGDETSPDCVTAVRDAAILLESLGHTVIEVDLPLDADELSMTYLTIVAASVAVDVLHTEDQTGVPPRPDMFELPTWFLRQIGEELSARELQQARDSCQRLGRNIAALYHGHQLDMHLSATMAYPPVKVGELSLSAIERVALSTLRRASTGMVLRTVLSSLAETSLAKTPNTQVFNMTGQPAMNVPLWWNDAGLPIGVQVAAKFGDEKTLFRLAHQLEQARPWADKIPVMALT